MRDRKWFLRIAVLSLVISFMVWMVHAWRAGSYPTFIAEAVIALGVLYWSLHVRLARLVPAAQIWRVDNKARSLAVRPNRVRVVVFMTAVIGAFVGLFLLGVFYLFGILAAPGSTPSTVRDRPLLGLLPVVGSISGVLALFIAGSLLMARGNTGSLVIGRDGVSVSSLRTRRMPWSDVQDIRLIGPEDRAPQQAALIVDGKPEELKLPLHLFPKDSAVLADLVRFYWLHPSCRDELGTESALARWSERLYPGATNPGFVDSKEPID